MNLSNSCCVHETRFAPDLCSHRRGGSTTLVYCVIVVPRCDFLFFSPAESLTCVRLVHPGPPGGRRMRVGGRLANSESVLSLPLALAADPPEKCTRRIADQLTLSAAPRVIDAAARWRSGRLSPPLTGRACSFLSTSPRPQMPF